MSEGLRRIVLWVNGACIVVLLGAGLAGVLLVDDEKKPSRPKAWDPRVLDLVQFVERERGHPFKYPVDVDFLTAAEYTEETRTDPESLTEDDREEVDDVEGLLRALGLVTGEVDLLEAGNEITDTGTLAYYDSEEERVVIRGTEVSPGLAVTLVHELTHVLQDQTFDLDRFGGEGEDDEDAPEVTSGQYLGFRALAEGDADRIEARYVDSLDEARQKEIGDSRGGDSGELDDKVPQALQALFAAPYILGGSFVALLEALGTTEIDKAFARPPATEEHLLDPFAFLEGDGARPVATPGTDGLDVIDEGDFGAVNLLVVLAERVDVVQALSAATGWGGDAYAVFRRDGKACVRMHITGDQPSDTNELEESLRVWSNAAPAGSTTLTRDREIVRFESCDPGAGAKPGSGSSFEALGLASGRTELAILVLDEGLERDDARCVAAALVTELTVEELQAERPSRRVQRVSAEIGRRCRAN